MTDSRTSAKSLRRTVFVICHLSFVILDRSQISKDLNAIKYTSVARKAEVSTASTAAIAPDKASVDVIHRVRAIADNQGQMRFVGSFVG